MELDIKSFIGIVIIFAPPRTGKTCLLTHILNTYAFDKERNRDMQREIRERNAHKKYDCRSETTMQKGIALLLIIVFGVSL